MLKIDKENIFVIAVATIILIVALAVIKSFIIPLIFTFILTYILNPLYKKSLKIIKNQEINSLIFAILILMMIILPITFISLNLTKEINSVNDVSITSSLNKLNSIIIDKYQLNINLNQQYNLVFIKIKQELQNFFFKIPSYIFQIFLIIFFYYYFSKDYNYEIRFFRKEFNPKNFKYIKIEFEKLVNGIIYGQIFVRLIQSLVAILGFLIIGLDQAIIAGIMIFFAAFMPIIGTGLIWIPLVLINLLNQQYYTAILIMILGIFISTIDNFLLPYIVSEKTNMGPVMTLISILGGIELFGLYGIILGPFFVGILFILIEDIFEKIKKSNPKLNRYTWSENERKKFKSLKTDFAKDEYIKIINLRKEKNIHKHI